jgi:hypothetical protein
MQQVGLNADQFQFIRVRARMESRLYYRANWFFSIAGLALVNAVVLLVRGGWGMMIGLGFSQLIAGAAVVATAELGAGDGLVVKLVALGANLGLAGLFVFFGWLARRRQPWGFAAGMLVYALDGSIFLLAGDMWSVGFHIFALLWLFRGFRTARQLRRLERAVVSPQPGYPRPGYLAGPLWSRSLRLILSLVQQ